MSKYFMGHVSTKKFSCLSKIPFQSGFSFFFLLVNLARFRSDKISKASFSFSILCFVSPPQGEIHRGLGKGGAHKKTRRVLGSGRQIMAEATCIGKGLLKQAKPSVSRFVLKRKKKKWLISSETDPVSPDTTTYSRI